MTKMRDENIGERSKRVNSSPYFHRGRMSCILITSKMIMWNQGNISLQKVNAVNVLILHRICIEGECLVSWSLVKWSCEIREISHCRRKMIRSTRISQMKHKLDTFCVFAVFWSPRFAHVAFIFVLALHAAEEKVLLFSLQAPCLCFPRKAILN